MESTRIHLSYCLCPAPAQSSRRNPRALILPISQIKLGAQLQWRSTSETRRIFLCRNAHLEKESESKEEKEEQEDRTLLRRKLAVFVSGGGSNFRAIHQASSRGLINGEVVLLVTDKPGCGGAQYATDHKIPLAIYPKTKSSSEGLSPIELVTTLREFGVEFVLLAGYLKLIPSELVQAFPRAILNIHPALLPAFGGKGFYGQRVHAAVVASGARFSGATVHFVDEHYDSGRILAQRIVPVLADDTPEQLAGRVLAEEHKLYPEAVAALCEGRIIWRDDGVPLIKSQNNPEEYTGIGINAWMGEPDMNLPRTYQRRVKARVTPSIQATAKMKTDKRHKEEAIPVIDISSSTDIPLDDQGVLTDYSEEVTSRYNP